ncbi:acyl-CoA N-acyltransferase [Leucogyrophana mollusca]|uniref:Acyl-CoA N-acyltransferase n=1 Tax=Leucogyrophana mollusca TaxID=85980 RepID=A0ACB8BZL0_9AGAM|nr:acyl-CoA N-acyltransferase [Leucogyrophana mollusca]
MPITIRPATKADEDAVFRICLLTSNAGTSAVDLHTFPKLPGYLYAAPYLHLKSAWAFLLVDTNDNEEKVVGYIVGASDTRAFEKDAEENWYPPLREQYEKYLQEPADAKPTDITYINTIMKPHLAADANIDFASPHLHINVLPGYQGKGYGRQLIGTAVQYLGGEGFKGVWLGMDPRNTKAAAFYQRLGFKPFEGAPEAVVGLRFEDWGKKKYWVADIARKPAAHDVLFQSTLEPPDSF